MEDYGKELILDLHEVKNTHLFTRKDLEKFVIDLCDLIDMVRCDLHFWDYEGDQEEYDKAPIHLKGTSAIQFITTSNITIHTLDEMKRVYLNIFTCKPFNEEDAIRFCKNWFDGDILNKKVIRRI